MSNFDYSAYFGRMRDIERLQISSDAINWMERYTPAERAYDYLLYLGCNITRTPYIAHDVVAVFGQLGLDFAAVGGVQFCCGIPWEQENDTSQSTKVGKRTLGRISDYQPKTLVMWCPSCNVHFTDALLVREGPLDCEIVHTPALLKDLVETGALTWSRRIDARVAIHAHQGRNDHSTGQERALADAKTTTALLGSIPGVEVVATITSPAEFDYDCGPISASMPPDEMRREQDRVIDLAVAADASTLVTISHACHREWCVRGSDDLPLRNYISLVAEGLGLAPMTDWLQRFRSADDPEKVVDMAEAPWRSHGLSRDDAIAMARSYFGEAKRMSP